MDILENTPNRLILQYMPTMLRVFSLIFIILPLILALIFMKDAKDMTAILFLVFFGGLFVVIGVKILLSAKTVTCIFDRESSRLTIIYQGLLEKDDVGYPLSDIREAKVSESAGTGDESPTYKLYLSLNSGEVLSLTNSESMGRNHKYLVADLINKFLNPQPNLINSKTIGGENNSRQSLSEPNLLPKELQREQVKVSQRVTKNESSFNYKEVTNNLENDLATGDFDKDKKIVGAFVQIPPGEFLMGSNSGSDDEKPVHKVIIAQGYEMGKYQITQDQWETVMGHNPSSFKGKLLPVDSVSWEDVQQFIGILNSNSNNYNYRLPTEAEWEYACRAGTRGDYAGDLDTMGWYQGNSGNHAHEVGKQQPNAWGLYDMHGNVWEWCLDWYGPYPRGVVTNPKGASSGAHRVKRGGGWYDIAAYCRSTDRSGYAPNYRLYDVGFRLVRTPR